MSKVIAALAVSIDGFDWHFDGDVPGPDGAVICGHTTYVHSSHLKSGSPSTPLVVLSHGEVPERSEHQTLAHTIEDAVAKARELADGKDVGLMGGGVVTSALVAGLLDEIVLHQVPVLLGGGRPFFGELPGHVDLRLIEVVPAPGVTHLRYEVLR
jgi:dihydrofolate reductase